jgi:hypothetical protein
LYYRCMKHVDSWLRVLFTLIVILVMAISTWILGIRMRRRIKRALGADVQNDVELTSLKTWMNAEDAEERNRGGKLS